MRDLPIELTYFEASFDPRPVRRVYKNGGTSSSAST